MFVGEEPLPSAVRQKDGFGKGKAKEHIREHIAVCQNQADDRKLACQLMRECLQFDPSKRPKLSNIMEHKWFKSPSRLSSIPCPPALQVQVHSLAQFCIKVSQYASMHQ